MAGKKEKKTTNPIGGTPEKFTPQQVCDALETTRGLVSLAAKILKCNPSTVHSYINKYSEVKEALTDARELQLDLCENSLFSAIDQKEGWAVRWYLATIGKTRGYVERSEVTGADGGPIPTAVMFVPHVSHDTDNP